MSLSPAAAFPGLTLDASCLMPNHLHGLIVLSGEGNPPPSIPDLLRWFKSQNTLACVRGVRASRFPPFAGALWQRRYYDHIVRDEVDLARIREYIANNPLQWESDPENLRRT